MKFVFDKKFKFEDFPEINKCHIKYNQLVCNAYEIESKYDNGECPEDFWLKALDLCDNYYSGEYAKTVHNEFYGKGLKISNWHKKKPISFDEKFSSDFESISDEDRNNIVSIVEIKYGWKLSADFYEKK